MPRLTEEKKARLRRIHEREQKKTSLEHKILKAAEKDPSIARKFGLNKSKPEPEPFIEEPKPVEEVPVVQKVAKVDTQKAPVEKPAVKAGIVDEWAAIDAYRQAQEEKKKKDLKVRTLEDRHKMKEALEKQVKEGEFRKKNALPPNPVLVSPKKAAFYKEDDKPEDPDHGLFAQVGKEGFLKEQKHLEEAATWKQIRLQEMEAKKAAKEKERLEQLAREDSEIKRDFVLMEAEKQKHEAIKIAKLKAAKEDLKDFIPQSRVRIERREQAIKADLDELAILDKINDAREARNKAVVDRRVANQVARTKAQQHVAPLFANKKEDVDKDTMQEKGTSFLDVIGTGNQIGVPPPVPMETVLAELDNQVEHRRIEKEAAKKSKDEEYKMLTEMSKAELEGKAAEKAKLLKAKNATKKSLDEQVHLKRSLAEQEAKTMSATERSLNRHLLKKVGLA